MPGTAVWLPARWDSSPFRSVQQAHMQPTQHIPDFTEATQRTAFVSGILRSSMKPPSDPDTFPLNAPADAQNPDRKPACLIIVQTIRRYAGESCAPKCYKSRPGLSHGPGRLPVGSPHLFTNQLQTTAAVPAMHWLPDFQGNKKTHPDESECVLAGAVVLEPTTYGFGDRDSTN